MKTSKYLLNQIPQLKGRIIAIDVDDYILDAIDANDSINECIQLTSLGNGDGKWHFSLFSKRISSRKMKKKFKKKKIDSIILNNCSLKQMLNTFIRDSIYMTKTSVYIYGSDEVIPSDLLIARYKRYDTKIEYIKENGYIIKIDTTKAKNNWFKDLGYYLVDNFAEFTDAIAQYLVN